MAHPQSHPTSFISGIVDRSRILGASFCLPTSCAYYTAIDITSPSSRYSELRTDIGRKVFRSCLGISSSPRATGPGGFGSVVKSLLYANVGDKLVYILHIIRSKRRLMHAY